MIASVDAATILGARGHPVTVEVHVSQGLPAFTMLGLPDESCREARDRVRAAVMSAGYRWPEKKIVVNLAPPQFRKTGSGLDVAIAVGILIATGDIPPDAVRGYAFVGELGLDGSVRAVPGVAPMVGVRPDHDWVVPAGCVTEARVAAHADIRAVSSLRELVEALTLAASWPDLDDEIRDVVAPDLADLADVRGQPVARKALEIAAAGGHHLLFVGSPGSGKTMLAERLPGLLPDLTGEVALETTMVHSAAGTKLPPSGLITRPPLRAPHHSSSLGSLVGGGGHQQRPGEISLAHGSAGQYPMEERTMTTTNRCTCTTTDTYRQVDRACPTHGDAAEEARRAAEEARTTSDVPATDTDDENISLEDRRACLELVALDGLRATADMLDDDIDALLDYVLRSICTELCLVSIRLETETAPALAVAGSWLGGVLGVDSAAEDEMGRVMHQRGRELRDHITRQIGWPKQMVVAS